MDRAPVTPSGSPRIGIRFRSPPPPRPCGSRRRASATLRISSAPRRDEVLRNRRKSRPGSSKSRQYAIAVTSAVRRRPVRSASSPKNSPRPRRRWIGIAPDFDRARGDEVHRIAPLAAADQPITGHGQAGPSSDRRSRAATGRRARRTSETAEPAAPPTVRGPEVRPALDLPPGHGRSGASGRYRPPA